MPGRNTLAYFGTVFETKTSVFITFTQLRVFYKSNATIRLTLSPQQKMPGRNVLAYFGPAFETKTISFHNIHAS
jgi:hypothetical protein